MLALIVVPIILAALVVILTQGQPKTYVSKTRIYTGLASGYSIESQENMRLDFFGVNNAFDNLINIIKSRSTVEETSLALMAQHLSREEADPKYISSEHFKKLDGDFPDNVKSLIIKNDEKRTFENIRLHTIQTDTNFFQRIFTSEHAHYSIKALSKFKVWRVQSSDIIEISFESDDPGICQNTLLILSKVFTAKFAAIRINQTDQVVSYFENQLKQTADRLSKAEDRLLSFNQKNNIINYNEQTRNISTRKEELDEQYYEIQMSLAGANAVILKIEEQLEGYSGIKMTNVGLDQLRKELADVSSRLAFAQIPSPNDSVPKFDSKEISFLKSQSDSLKKEMSLRVDSLINISENPEGIPVADLLKNWLDNVMNREENYAKQEVIQMRRLEFLEIYRRFAPLGAILKRIEREINVAEQEYLQQLKSLAQAKLKQQNNQLASDISVIDPPDFPLKAESSKRKLLVVVAGMFGFILVAFTVLVLAYINPNIQIPQKAVKYTGLEIAGVLPTTESSKEKVDFSYINRRLTEMWMQNLLLEEKRGKDDGPIFIGVGSSRESEGKSYSSTGLAKNLRKAQKKLLYITYVEEYKDASSDTYDFVYKLTPTFINVAKLEELFPSEGLQLSDYDYVLLELPPINETPYPQKLVSCLDVFYLVINANRAWTKADQFSLSILQQVLLTKPKIVLNGVSLDVVEDYIGQVPKKRNRLRKIVLKVLRRQFFRKLFKK